MKMYEIGTDYRRDYTYETHAIWNSYINGLPTNIVTFFYYKNKITKGTYDTFWETFTKELEYLIYENMQII